MVEKEFPKRIVLIRTGSLADAVSHSRITETNNGMRLYSKFSCELNLDMKDGALHITTCIKTPFCYCDPGECVVSMR